jgi:hypothetical protein
MANIIFNLLPKSQLIIDNNLDNMPTYWNSFVILKSSHHWLFFLFIFSGLNVKAYFDFKLFLKKFKKNYLEKDFLAIFFKRQLQYPTFNVF